MAIDKIFNDGNVDGIADNIFNAVNNSVSEVKQMQQRKAAENAQMVVQSLKKIDTDIREKYDNVTTTLEKRIITIKDGRDGINGKDGRDGKNGKDGRDGKDGKTGPQGPKGQDGVDGVDGVSVANANIDFDGSLIIALSDGREINVGEVVSTELQDRIKVITSGGAGGGGGSGTVSNVATGTGLTGGPITTTGTIALANTAVTAGTYTAANITVDAQGRITAAANGSGGGGGTVTSVALSGGTTGLTVTGSPITTSGTITLAGTLAVANGGTGTTTPSIVAGTNITVTGSWPNQTIAASGAASGDVVGPASATDNALVRFDSTTGKLIQNSVVIVADTTGNMSGVGTLSVGGELTYGGVTLSNAVTGTGKMVLDTSPTLVTPALGTPASGVLTNATGLPISSGVSGLGTGVATFLGTPSSANLASAVTDETGTGALVFATSPTFVTPILGTPTSGTLTNATGLPISSGVSGLGTGVATALAVNVGSAGAPVVNGGALGTPSGGTATNLTGLPLSTGVTGTLPIANGGTGQTTLAAASIATYTGTETLTNKTLTNPTVTNYVETPFTANSSTAITLALTNGTVQIITLTGNATITMPTAVSGKSFTLLLKQDGTGSRTVTWSTVSWPSATAPTITSTASKMDKYVFISDGTYWYGATAGQNYT